MQPTHRLPPLSLEGRSEARRDLFFFSARTSTIHHLQIPANHELWGVPRIPTTYRILVPRLRPSSHRSKSHTHKSNTRSQTHTHASGRSILGRRRRLSQHQHSRGTHALLCSHHPPTRTAGRPHDTEERSRRVVGGIATAGRPARITSAGPMPASRAPLHSIRHLLQQPSSLASRARRRGKVTGRPDRDSNRVTPSSALSSPSGRHY
jgi:hypothetical protein